MKVNDSRSATAPAVTANGERLVSHAGVGMLAEAADLSGLTAGLSGLFAGQGVRWRRHAPGVSLVRAAAAIADGMGNVSEVGLFCSSRRAIFTRPAAVSTLRRAVFAFGAELMTPGLDRVLAQARTRAWQAAGYAPATLTIDVDATLLDCHSEKQDAAPNYKSGFGYHPLGAWLDETREPLAMLLRPGNAGSNTAVDHCDVLFRSLAQLPYDYQTGHRPGDDPADVTHPILVRADSAGATKDFLADLRERNINFSVGFAIDAATRQLIENVPETAWLAAINTDRTERAGAQVGINNSGSTIGMLRPSLRPLAAYRELTSLAALSDAEKMWRQREVVTCLDSNGAVASLPVTVGQVSREPQPPLDGRTLKPHHLQRICAVYGMEADSIIRTHQTLSLKKLSDARNDIAHGNMPFEAVLSRAGFSPDDIRADLDSFDEIGYRMVVAFDGYLSRREFLAVPAAWQSAAARRAVGAMSTARLAQAAPPGTESPRRGRVVLRY